MSLIIRFLGLRDREQSKRTVEVVNYAQKKKEKFFKDMAKYHKEAKLIHIQSIKNLEKSVTLVNRAQDVTTRIAIATGGLKKYD